MFLRGPIRCKSSSEFTVFSIQINSKFFDLLSLPFIRLRLRFLVTFCRLFIPERVIMGMITVYDFCLYARFGRFLMGEVLRLEGVMA